jgi:hypothetical protein
LDRHRAEESTFVASGRTSLTLNAYLHVLPAMQEAEAEQLDELLTPLDVSKAMKDLKELQLSYRRSAAPR